MKKLKHESLYLFAYYSLKFIVAALPDFALNLIAKIVAKIVFRLNTKHRKIIDKNLSLCFENLDKKARDEISAKIYQNFAKFGLELIKNQNAKKEKILQKVVFENEQVVEEIIASKRPFIITTAHYGNWELLPLGFVSRFKPLSIVGRSLDSVKMNELLSKNRTQFDIELIDKKGGLKKMIKALKDGRVLGILTDQNASLNESIRLKFFGHEVNYITGASVIAKKMNAIMMSVFIYQKNGKFYVRNYEPIDASTHSVAELTHYQARCCEDMISFKPDEYFFFHRRFDKEIYDEK